MEDDQIIYISENTEAWIDGGTGVTCQVRRNFGTSYFKGSKEKGGFSGYVAIPPGHPWFGQKKSPVKVAMVYGTMLLINDHWGQHKDSWWLFFSSEVGEDWEDVKQKCRILAAQVEVAGTSLAQQIDSTPFSEIHTRPGPRLEKNTQSALVKMHKELEYEDSMEDDGPDEIYDYFKYQWMKNSGSSAPFPVRNVERNEPSGF